MTTFRMHDHEARDRLAAAAWAEVTQDHMIGLAVRRDRLRHRESQRVYAVRRSFSNTFLARLETRPGDLRLGSVLAALEGTAYGLAVVPREVRATLAADLVDVDADLVSRLVRDGLTESGLSVRRFAELHGLPRMTLLRASKDSASLKLRAVRQVLGACGQVLVVSRRDGGAVVQATDWEWGELAGEARGGQRRLAGHRITVHTPDGPMWWWLSGEMGTKGEPPQWTTVPPDTSRLSPRTERDTPWWVDSA